MLVSLKVPLGCVKKKISQSSWNLLPQGQEDPSAVDVDKLWSRVRVIELHLGHDADLQVVREVGPGRRSGPPVPNLAGLGCCRTAQQHTAAVQHQQHVREVGKGAVTRPILVSLGAHSLSPAKLVVFSDGRGRHLGCARVFISLIYHLYSISTPGQVLE